MSTGLAKVLNENRYFYAIPSKEILDNLDFNNPFVYLEFLKTYWKQLIIVLKNLNSEAWKRLDGSKENFQFDLLWEADNESGMNFREEWFTALAYNLWEQWGLNIKTLRDERP